MRLTKCWRGGDILEEALVLGDEVIAGQNVAEELGVLADPISQQLLPNPGHLNQPISKVK